MGKYDMIENRSPGEKAGNIISDEGNCFMEEMRKKGNRTAAYRCFPGPVSGAGDFV